MDVVQQVVSSSPVQDVHSDVSPTAQVEDEPSASASSTAPVTEKSPVASVPNAQVEASSTAPQTNLANESLLRERESLQKELKRLKTERQSLIEEGNKMSRRMAAIEAKMKEVMGEARCSEARSA